MSTWLAEQSFSQCFRMEPANDNNEKVASTPVRSGSDSGEQFSFVKALLQRKYDLWALNNSDSVSHIETSLKTLLFFLPGRFRDQELGSELCTPLSSLFFCSPMLNVSTSSF